MRTACGSSRPGGKGVSTRQPRDQTPLDQALGADPPGADTPSLWTEFLTHACENITLPQTSFAGGNYTWGFQRRLILVRMCKLL